MGYLDKAGLSRAFTKLKTLIDKKQDAMKTVAITSSSNTNKGKWIKFATIDLSSAAAWVQCSGTLSFIRNEGESPLGLLKFEFRNGNTAGTVTTMQLYWTNLNNSNQASSVASVKVSNGKYDIYYKPINDYETPVVSLIDSANSKYFTFNVGSYVASITVASTSVISSYASSAASVPWSGVTGKPSTYAPSSHTHDDRYYTETEIDSKLSGKANSSHTHTKSQITDFPSSMPASDVYSWAKASTKPSYSWSEIGSKPSTFAPSAHTHNNIISRGNVTAETGVGGRPAVDGLSMSQVYNNGYPTTYGNVISLRGTGDGQILVGWSSIDGAYAPVYVRNKRDNTSSANWSDWQQFYTTGYKPTKADVGLGNVENKSSATIRGELTKANVTTALGYTPPTSDTNTWRGVQNNLTSTATDQSLSAYQGKVLNDKFASYVPTSRTVNGKALSANISLSASDVGAAASSHTHNYAASSSAGGNANWANGATYANYSYNDKPITTGGTGSAYTASVSGLTLVAGASFVMVPNVVSTTTAPTLNVNSLGAKTIRMRISSSTSSTVALPSASFLAASKPVRMVYDGTYWIIDDMVRPDINNAYGTLVSSGTAAPTSSNGGYIYIQYG